MKKVLKFYTDSPLILRIAIGLVIGNTLGANSKSKAEWVGGIVLICIGTKILLEHTGIL